MVDSRIISLLHSFKHFDFSRHLKYYLKVCYLKKRDDKNVLPKKILNHLYVVVYKCVLSIRCVD